MGSGAGEVTSSSSPNISPDTVISTPSTAATTTDKSSGKLQQRDDEKVSVPIGGLYQNSGLAAATATSAAALNAPTSPNINAGSVLKGSPMSNSTFAVMGSSQNAPVSFGVTTSTVESFHQGSSIGTLSTSIKTEPDLLYQPQSPTRENNSSTTTAYDIQNRNPEINPQSVLSPLLPTTPPSRALTKNSAEKDSSRPVAANGSSTLTKPIKGVLTNGGDGQQQTTIRQAPSKQINSCASLASIGSASTSANNTIKGNSSTTQLGDRDSGRENTGRWTCEEHLLFLKGLEMHGKGWKKIAKLIKTRTVVQIRTHAQKYFQKLTKAKKNGHHGDELLMENSRFGRRMKLTGKRRGLVYSSYLVGMEGTSASISHALQPFMPTQPSHDSLSDKEEDAAIERGLYRFLSPMIIEPEIAGIDSTDPEIIPPVPSINDEDGDCSDTETEETTEPLPTLANVTDDMYARCGVPEWFKKGANLEELLEEATQLDWAADHGGDPNHLTKGRAHIAEPPGPNPTPWTPTNKANGSKAGKSKNGITRRPRGTNKEKASNGKKAQTTSPPPQQQQAESEGTHQGHLVSANDFDVTSFGQQNQSRSHQQAANELEDDLHLLDEVFDRAASGSSSGHQNHRTDAHFDSYLSDPGHVHHGLNFLDHLDDEDAMGIEF